MKNTNDAIVFCSGNLAIIIAIMKVLAILGRQQEFLPTHCKVAPWDNYPSDPLVMPLYLLCLRFEFDACRIYKCFLWTYYRLSSDI